MNDKDMHTINLFEWTGLDGVRFTRSEEELQEVFLNEDKAMRYLHENGFCVDSFDPRDIDLVDGSKNCIRFNKFSKLPNDGDETKIIRNNIFVNACLQVGLYTHTLANLNEDYLYKNFNEFAQYLPNDYAQYYRVIIQNYSPKSYSTINDITKIYLCDFTIKRNNNELEKLKKELGEESTDNEEITVSNEELINKDINDIIYADLISKQKTKGMSDFAFVHVLILPALVLSIGIIICLISFALNLFG